MSMHPLLYRKQFLMTTLPTDELSSWAQNRVGNHTLYTHPELLIHQAKKNNTHIIVLGHVLDPFDPEFGPDSLAKRCANTNNENEIAEEIYGLSGRFVLIILRNNRLAFFNDACGLRSFFYTTTQGTVQLASQPLLLKLVVPERIIQGKRYHSYFDSPYAKNNKETYFPSGTSLYEGVHHLVPNHYLDTAKMEQIRYWPNKNHTEIEYSDGKAKFAEMLQNTMRVASKKYKLALGVTSGFDSRIILSACKPVKERMLFYTLQYRDYTYKSRDIRIPVKLKSILEINHEVLDCRVPIDPKFERIYKQNSDMAHLDDWGLIAYGISQTLPKEKVAIKGSCSETGRCYFYKSGRHPEINDSSQLLEINSNWKDIPFIEKQLDSWFSDAKKTEMQTGYKLLDLFHWEVSTGSWQMQNQLEWDIVHETFTPFNNRKLLDIMLRIPTKYRSKPGNYQLYRDTINQFWPEALSEPINPPTMEEWIKTNIKSVLGNLGVKKYHQY